MVLYVVLLSEQVVFLYYVVRLDAHCVHGSACSLALRQLYMARCKPPACLAGG